jgi:predicted phage terminase large subunit-like protein
LTQFKSSYQASAEGGQRAWSALYQCSPRVEGGNLVRREWWRYYNPKDVPVFGTEVISVDASFKDAEHNDYVAITVWGKSNNDYYLQYCMNRHLDFTNTLAAIRSVRAQYPNARTVLIEDKANGSAIINVLQHEMFCVPVNPKGGKVARVNAVSAAIESGHVYVPEDAPWLSDYIDQWCAFPAGAHDDMVDSSSQALSYLLYSSGYSASMNVNDRERAEQELIEQEKEIFLTGAVYDVYGLSDDMNY